MFLSNLRVSTKKKKKKAKKYKIWGLYGPRYKNPYKKVM